MLYAVKLTLVGHGGACLYQSTWEMSLRKTKSFRSQKQLVRLFNQCTGDTTFWDFKAENYRHVFSPESNVWLNVVVTLQMSITVGFVRTCFIWNFEWGSLSSQRWPWPSDHLAWEACPALPGNMVLGIKSIALGKHSTKWAMSLLLPILVLLFRFERASPDFGSS